MSSDRRQFLQRVAVGAATFAAAPSVLHASPRHVPTNAGTTSGPYSDVSDAAVTAAMAAAAMAAAAPAADPEWDTGWTKKLTGKHKALFDVPGVSGGAGVLRAGLWARQYTDVFKAAPSDLSAVIVLRHEGIVLAMNHAFWEQYKVGKRNKLKDDDGKRIEKNPALAQPLADGEKARPFDALMLEAQIASGVVVLACNMAFGGCVAAVMKEDKLDRAAAREKAKAMLITGIILQPSGIFANVLAQQSGCVFVAAS